MSDVTIKWDEAPDGGSVIVEGRLCTDTLSQVETSLSALRKTGHRLARIDLSGLSGFDTGGAWVVTDLQRQLGGEIDGLSPEQLSLLDTVTRAMPNEQEDGELPRGFVPMLERLGRGTYAARDGILSFVSFFGQTIICILGSLIRPWRLRRASLVSQMQIVGISAVPIVALMGFLIGIVLAFQGVAQLRQFGAEIFVVELIAVSVLRELGILLTAIIVAGRSGSAFTASIGSMKVQEEIDAMRTLGLDPMEALVVPRVLALIIMLPVLGFIANMSGLIGGALMNLAVLDVSLERFATRLVETTSVKNFYVGMIKAPFFAATIGVVACWQGMQVRGSADSVGQKTTAAVVQSIFLVILIDALFSIFFSELGI
ncbi:MAG: ABC transporter permease [Rhodobacteraceae bacterium]|nr:ABC transporter permease [Paracoccaceae bacterium]